MLSNKISDSDSDSDSLTLISDMVYFRDIILESSSSLAFVRGIHRWPVDSPHKRPESRKMFPFDSVIMTSVKYRV